MQVLDVRVYKKWKVSLKKTRLGFRREDMLLEDAEPLQVMPVVIVPNFTVAYCTVEFERTNHTTIYIDSCSDSDSYDITTAKMSPQSDFEPCLRFILDTYGTMSFLVHCIY